MTITARVEPDETRRPLGHARLVIAGAPPGAAGAAGLRFRREGHSKNNLGPDGWQVGEAVLRPVNIAQEGAETVLILGPRLTRHVEVGPVHVVLPGLGEVGMFWPDSIEVFEGDLPPEAPGPEDTAAVAPERIVAPAAAPPPVPAPAPAAAPVPPAAPPPPPETAKAKPPVALIVGGVLAVVAAAILAWFLLGGEQQPTPPPIPPPPAASAPPAAPPTAPPGAPPAGPAWPESADGLGLRDLVAQAADAAAIRTAALRRQQQGRHDDALVLLEEAAERGDAPAMTALGRLYDPIGFVAGRPLRNPDPRAAARYYRDAERAGDAAAAPLRTALRAWLQQQADQGNGAAASALREFW